MTPYQKIKAKWDHIESTLAKGKGEWNEPGYVRVDVWNYWRGQEAALRWALQQFPGTEREDDTKA